ncbi:MAG: hypothetical protein ACK4S3_05345 [Parvibaculum sp.]
MRAKPESEWRPETVTARDLVQDSSVVATISCIGCGIITEINVWQIGCNLADTSLQTLRLRCRRCGVYPKEVEIGRRTSGIGEKMLTIPLKPRCWDSGHADAQRIALERAARRRQARTEAALQELRSKSVQPAPNPPRRRDDWL